MGAQYAILTPYSPSGYRHAYRRPSNHHQPSSLKTFIAGLFERTTAIESVTNCIWPACLIALLTQCVASNLTPPAAFTPSLGPWVLQSPRPRTPFHQVASCANHLRAGGGHTLTFRNRAGNLKSIRGADSCQPWASGPTRRPKVRPLWLYRRHNVVPVAPSATIHAYEMFGPLQSTFRPSLSSPYRPRVHYHISRIFPPGRDSRVTGLSVSLTGEVRR